jgi:hypothetical protein
VSDKTYFWSNYAQHPPEVQEKVLEELEQLLPLMTVREQAQAFYGCPSDVVLRFLPQLAWDTQVKIWKECLPVGARDKAWPLLKPEARSKIKPRRGRSLCLA